MPHKSVRHLVVVLGDQLDPESAAFAGFDPDQDVVWMAEVAGEATAVWSHRARIVLFLAAMRHHREALLQRGWRVRYRELDDPHNHGTLAAELAASLATLRPRQVVMVEAGDWAVEAAIQATCAAAGVALELRPDQHFLCSRGEFTAWAATHKQWRQEWFYRDQRRRLGVLMEGDKPLGGRWNFDADNRDGPGGEQPALPSARTFPPDALTRAVMTLVMRRFPDHPGALETFAWPVTPDDARAALEDFITNRLAAFGRWQDVRLDNDPWLAHARLSAALNLKLLNPRACIAAAEHAVRSGAVELAAGEGFIRQILGWREYVRGVYWSLMPDYVTRNHLEAQADLPAWYWTGAVPMRCLAVTIGDSLRNGYAHHIQRLMVTGLYALLMGVEPQQVHRWYLAMYVDAVEWVELPNTLGMALYADGGVMASKPYVASGAYQARMGDSCAGCAFDPKLADGPRACPFTTLYWDFLARHRSRLAGNPRLANQLRNVERMDAARLERIRAQAARLLANHGVPP